MVACFFCKTGHVATVPFEQRSTLNSEWYTTICLPKIFEVIRKTNKRRRILVHHDNFFSGQNVELMGPDLAPNDFFLFPHIKKNAWSTIFVARRCFWSVQSPCFGDVFIGVEKQTQMMVVHQNILSTVMLKNHILSNGNVRSVPVLTIPEICHYMF